MQLLGISGSKIILTKTFTFLWPLILLETTVKPYVVGRGSRVLFFSYSFLLMGVIYSMNCKSISTSLANDNIFLLEFFTYFNALI